jgi:hypothetical protein
MTVLLEREFLPCHTGSEDFCLAPIPQPKNLFVKSLATEMKPHRDAISGPNPHYISLFASTDPRQKGHRGPCYGIHTFFVIGRL